MASQNFDVIFQEIFEFIYELCKTNQNGPINEALKYFKEMTKYNVFDGKKNRGKIAVHSVEHLINMNGDVDLRIKQANVVGCCIEIMQASFLVHDDIMDNSLTRRNKQCWYLLQKSKGHGLIGVNDSLHLNTLVFKILQLYFKNEPFYVDMLELFQETIYQTCAGQCLDMLTGGGEQIDWSIYTNERYKEIVKWKTAYYSFYLPVASAMIIAGVKDKEEFNIAEMILLNVGEYFQVQDDYLDCYGDPNQTGKIGMDIEEGKCCWLVIQALQLGSEHQIQLIKKHYGKDDKESVKVVKLVYAELALEDVFKTYEEEMYAKISAEIDSLMAARASLITPVFYRSILDMIFKRKK